MRASCCVMVLPPTRYGAIAEHVGEHRADDANRIDAGVVIEAPIFDRQHRFLHPRRNGFQRDAAALLARPGHERGEQRRIERDALDVLARDRNSCDALGRRRRRLRRLLLARDRRFREGDRHDLAGLVAAARAQQHGVAIDREVAGALDPRALRVADIVQPRDQFRLAEALTGLQRQGPREHARHGAIALAVETRVDDASVRHVEIGHEAERDHDGDAQGNRDPAPVRRQHGRPTKARQADSPAAVVSFSSKRVSSVSPAFLTSVSY